MAGTIVDVEQLTIWRLCEILTYLAEQSDEHKERMDAQKRKRK